MRTLLPKPTAQGNNAKEFRGPVAGQVLSTERHAGLCQIRPNYSRPTPGESVRVYLNSIPRISGNRLKNEIMSCE